jgi:hypothetical protein
MRPDGLDAFTMCHANAVHESEVEGRVTLYFMTNQMELWNSDAPRIESGDIEPWNGRILREASLEILPPLAGNIVGDNDVGDPRVDTVREGGRYGIINVDVPESGRQVDRIDRKRVHYLSPFWRSTTPFGRTNTWWQETAATPIAMYPCECFVYASLTA